MNREYEQYTIPRAAAWLGLAGLIPFVTLAVVSVWLDGLLKLELLFVLVAYGAVILSFLGGIHWGLGMVPATGGSAGWRQLVAIVPSLIAWASLIVPSNLALPILALAFVIMLIVDFRFSAAGYAPMWYPRLRWKLTAVVVLCLLVAAYA